MQEGEWEQFGVIGSIRHAGTHSETRAILTELFFTDYLEFER